ncbi:MAG: tyrosine-type recombinase/integrase [Lawsonibacter sp.]|nr:tyrosine-type recombinase/integrase [Lawsonibacter sp.]
MRFHDLRHTAGSLLFEKAIKQIQEYLGHEKVSTTLDIYGHLSAEEKRKPRTL